MMLKGSPQYLIRQTYRVKAATHPAACRSRRRWPDPRPVAKHLGANRDRTVGSDEEGKTRAGPWLRPHHRLHAGGFRQRVDEITGGKKVPVVYDSVAKTRF